MPLPTIALRLSLSALARAASLALAGTSAALAQTAPPEEPPIQRVEITGSMIKRIDGEGALPVQTITAAEIKKLGVTTAAELMSKVSAAGTGLTDGASINVGGYDQKGFNSANLRGIGTSSTLVLLNGRRMANFASPGDDTGVDLNNIPVAAIQRVEILLDGASALYGTDAIGGVINFITRTDYQGVELNLYGGDTQEGGAGKAAASIAAGFGDLAVQGFNVFGVLDLQRTQALSTSQRDFIGDLKVPERLPHLLSGYTSPANIALTDEQFEHLRDMGYQVNGRLIESTLLNLSAPACDPPANLYLPDGIGGVNGCTYDYMRDTELYPKSEKVNLLGRGTVQLPGSHQAYGEIALSWSKTYYVGSAARPRAFIDTSLVSIPELAGLGFEDLDDPEVEVRARLFEAGARTSELTSFGQRYVAGLTGTLASWDYDVGLNHSVSTIKDKDTKGYLLYDELQDAISSGTVNVFGNPNPGDRAFYDSITVNDVVRQARGTMDSVDAKASRMLTQLPGGELAVGVGAEFRHEAQEYRPSALLMSDNIQGDDAVGSTGPTDDSRNVGAVYGELVIPFAKQWTAQLALRTDHYQGIGSSTNPKVGLLYQPIPELKLRSSAGTGFRAPSLTELNRPTRSGSTATLADPVCMAENDNDLAACANNWGTLIYSNRELEPEKSRQFSLGFVAQPNRHLSFSLDYWNIRRSNLIDDIGDDVILGNLDKYGNLVHRYNEVNNTNPDYLDECGDFVDPDDNEICYIELHKENRGSARSSGVDIMAELSGIHTAVGMLGVRLTGTYMIESKKQTGKGDPFISNLGRFVTDGVVQRWRHQLSFDWESGPFNASLSNTYYSGYRDQNSAIDTETGTVVGSNKVKAYSLWDVAGGWAFDKALTLRAGIRNLLDTPPPYSNQAYYFISGYDPSYTDPRGRFFYASVQYQFR